MTKAETLKQGKIYVDGNSSERVNVEVYVSKKKSEGEVLIHSGYLDVASLKDDTREDINPFAMAGFKDIEYSIMIAGVENDVIYMMRNHKELVKATQGISGAFKDSRDIDSNIKATCKIYLI